MRFYQIYDKNGIYIRFILARSKKQVKEYINRNLGNSDEFSIIFKR